MEELETLVKKKARLFRQQKRRVSKRTGTLAKQHARLKSVRGYQGGKGSKVKIIYAGKEN